MSWYVVLLIASLPAQAMGDSATASEYAVKAAIVFKIAKFVTWPERAFSEPDDSLFVCVQKDDPIAGAMSALSGRAIHGREFSVRYIDETTPIPDGCQILFLTTTPSARQLTLLREAADQPVLTIGDNDQFVARGGIVGLEIRQDRVQFAINVAASETAGLEISAQLLQLAKVMDDPAGK